MALDIQYKIWGGVAAAIALSSYLTWYGTQFEKTTGSRNARIAGESVEIESYENKIWGGGQYIRVDGTSYAIDAYKARLEEMVDKALEEKQE
ncbi:MAG: hypothetical protein Q8R18_05805 [bacterium]|nr:hypothetical protein [bacterium]